MRHSEHVAEAVEGWREELAALGGRDPLLSFRDLKVGTLDLAAADPEARRHLLDGEPVTLSKLFPHEPLRSSALRSARAIRDKARELYEERGLTTSLLAVGIATWANPFVAHRPTAPVLLRTAAVVARDPAETDFVITVADDPFVNPVLLHALDTQVGLRFNADDLRDHSGTLKYTTVVERVREFAPAHVVDGFSIAHRALLATFATEPLLLARDIEDLGAELDRHDVLAALAGDEKAQAAIGVTAPPAVTTQVPFDTDAHQHDVIAAAVGGGNLVVDAPPGTGSTQTVAGVVAELVVRGKRVLVVSQKRATANDLTARLGSVGLDDIVLDLSATTPIQAVQRVTDTARRLREASPVVGDEPADDAAGSGRATDRVRVELDEYWDAVHRVREPGGISAYDALATIANASEGVRTAVRISPAALEHLPSVSELRARLREYAELEGLTLTKDGSPWYGSIVPTPAVADALATTVAGLRDVYIPGLRDAATRAAVEVGLVAPGSINECYELVEMLSGVESTVKTFGAGVWNEPIDELVVATGGRASRDQQGTTAATDTGLASTRLGFLARRRLRRRAHELAARMSRRQRDSIHQRLVAARDQLAAWKRWSRDGKPPRVGEYVARAGETVTAVRRRLALLAEANPRAADLPEHVFAEVVRRLNALAMDESHLRAMPRLTELEAELSAAGLDALLDDLRRRGVRASRVEEILEYVQLTSLLEHWRERDPALRGFDVAEQRNKVAEFRLADQARVRAETDRVLRSRAAHFGEVAEDFPGQADVVVGAAGREATDGYHTPRQLVDAAPDVALAAIPCWVASPLTVPRLLPPRRLFDVVIVEDAGRVAVAHAVPAIARGSRVVMMADDEVPLTSFTTAVEPAPDTDDQDGPWAGDLPPSVAELLRGMVPTRRLQVPYRFRDDRLVGFAAETTYAGRMTTVPSAGGNARVTLELVDAATGGDEPVDSSSAEVSRVVELVLEHLRCRPHESLGVLTLGPRHAERLDAALRRALVRAPDVAGLLHEGRAEPFFVKDVERVAGDARDAIILSLGYGRSVDGRILYRFGALGRSGGERRLTSATTCARERLTVVSTFGAEDLSPRRLTTPGARALGDFLAYVEGGLSSFEREPAPGTDALAEAVARRLRHAGASVEVGYGGSAGVAVAVRHPVRRDRFVLAVETDAGGRATGESARELERIRPALLARLGWNVHRVWAEAWCSDPDGESKRLIQAYEEGVAAADAYDWAVAAAEADVVAGMPADEPLVSGEAGRQPDEPLVSGEAGKQPDEPLVSGETGKQPDEPLVSGEAGYGDEPEPVETADVGAADDGDAGADTGTGDADAPDDGAGEAAEAEEPDDVPAREGRRPGLATGWTVSDYTGRELAAFAHWVESDGVRRTESQVVDLVTIELGLSMDDARTRDVLHHAVRVNRAGAAPSA